MSGEEDKRKKRNRVTLDEVLMIEYNTEREEKKKKKVRKEKGKEHQRVEEKKKELSTTPILWHKEPTVESIELLG